VLNACRGVTLSADGVAAPLQHDDLLLDILLVRGLCVEAAEDPAALDAWLMAIDQHSKDLSRNTRRNNEDEAEVYVAIAAIIAELYRADSTKADLSESKRTKALEDLRALQIKWPSIGGSLEQRGILLEAMEDHPVVSGQLEASGTATQVRLDL